MSIINKPPEMVKREYELHEPIAVAVEKYATFIQSTPDHVVNSALKIVTWRDVELRRWRKQTQAGHPGTRAFHGHSNRGCGRLWKNGKLHVPLRRADFGSSRRRLLRRRQRRSDLLRTAHRHEGSTRATTTKQW